MGRFSDLNKGRINTYIESTSLEDLTISNEGIIDFIQTFFDEFIYIFQNLVKKTYYVAVNSGGSSDNTIKKYKNL